MTMQRWRFSAGAGLLVVLLASAALPAVAAEDSDVVYYRQLAMKQLDAESEALGMLVSGQMPPDTMVALTRAIANSAKVAAKTFELKVPGGDAKPEVFAAKWADFTSRMQQFVKKSDEMAKVAESGNVPKITELMVDALPCKQCHDLYRKKK